MGDMVPSVLLYGQAAGLLEELKEAQETGAVKDTADLIQELSAVLTTFQDSAGRPLLRYEEVSETEPPYSEKMNRFWKRAEKDINLLQQQVDILRAATVFSHNLVATEVLHAKNDNARLNNKLKTLQMYSNSIDSSIITFGDTFNSFEFIDIDSVSPSNRAALFHAGHVTLGQEGDMVNLSQDASIKILPMSNGFLGNNQEIDDPTEAPVDAETGDRLYTFKAEMRTYDDMEAITDDEPNTWIEYERYHLTESQKLSAKNMNFVYSKVDDDDNVERIDWATAPPGRVLKLGLEFDFHRIRNLNSIDLTPYGLEDNINYPILVRQIQTSPDGTDWTRVFPTNVWIGTDMNLQAARTANNVVIDRALWAFESRPVRYVRVFIEQHHSVQSNVGHAYWVERRNPDIRVEGPIPPEDNPTRYMDNRVMGELIQRREYFPGKRWAIGIRDLLMQQVEYKDNSTLITRPLRVGGLVDRVMLESADIQIPPDYPEEDHWVKFFVTPDDGENWYQIARIDDPFQEVPEQISFNDPLHESLREHNVINYVTDAPVTTLRLKVELSRPAELKSTTPVLKSYVLKVKRR